MSLILRPSVGPPHTCYTKQEMLDAIESVFLNTDEPTFTLTVCGRESIIIREAMRRYYEEPKSAAPMHPRLRPMSEAPLNEPLLVALDTGAFSIVTMMDACQRDRQAKGFYRLADLLRAAEIVAAITPEGYEYEVAGDVEPDTQAKHVWRRVWRRVNFRRIAPPVEYEYIAEAEPRIARSGDWVREGWQWKLVKADEHPYGGPQLCYRRVEVKR